MKPTKNNPTLPARIPSTTVDLPEITKDGERRRPPAPVEQKPQNQETG